MNEARPLWKQVFANFAAATCPLRSDSVDRISANRNPAAWVAGNRYVQWTSWDPKPHRTGHRDDPASALEALNEAREGIVLLRNEDKLLPLDRNKVRSIAVLGRLAPGVPATGFGSSFLVAIRSVSELSGIQRQAGPNVRVDFISAGSPDPESYSPAGSALFRVL